MTDRIRNGKRDGRLYRHGVRAHRRRPPAPRLATPMVMSVLADMEAAENAEEFLDAEIVVDEFLCCVGDRFIEHWVVVRLLRLAAISDASLYDDGSVFVINDVGRALLIRPELEAEILAAFENGGAVTIVDNRIQPI